jgi:hypothetical protein
MTLPYRHNFKWSINELLSLQREYELLEMSIQDIARKHERSVDAILYRLQKEGMIETWIDARGYQEYSKTFSYLVGSLDSNVNTYDYGEDIDVTDDDYVNDKDSDYEDENEESDVSGDDEDNDDISNLSERVWDLETAVNDIKGMINTLLSRISPSSSPSPSKKLKPTSKLSVEI